MGDAGIALLSAGLTMGLAAVGTAFAIGYLASKALDAIARQPEAANDIRVTGIIFTAFIEAIALYTLVVAILLIFK